MKCYLVQHGDALPKDVDADRALSATGRADVERLAAFMKNPDRAVTRIMHSGKTRARQSGEILAATLAPGVVVEAISGIDPLDDPEPLARQLMTWSDDAIIVGHVPFLGRLVSSLVAGDLGADLVSFLPGSVVCLERSDDSWAIIWMVRPELLNRSSE